MNSGKCPSPQIRSFRVEISPWSLCDPTEVTKGHKQLLAAGSGIYFYVTPRATDFDEVSRQEHAY